MKINRRKFLHSIYGSSISLPLLTHGPNLLGQTQTTHNYLHVYLRGGWTTFWACDPPTGSKLTSSGFDDTFKGQTRTTVSGKSNLIIGEGFAPAASAFASANTAFVNGIDSGQVVHEVGRPYSFTGQMSFSKERQGTALAAQMGLAKGGFPHISCWVRRSRWEIRR